MPKTQVGVGIGVIIQNSEGKILVMKRKGFAPYYSIPGGWLEQGETFEDCAIREAREETGLEIKNPKIIAVTNNLKTFKEEGLHIVSVVLVAESYSGEPKVCEPDKAEEILWADPHNLPEPHFEGSENGIKAYVAGKVYIQ